MQQIFLKTVQAFTIWGSTHVLTSIIFMLATTAGIYFEPVLCSQCGATLLYAILIGMALSSPVIVLLIPALFLIEKFTTVRSRMVFGFLVILFLSAALIIAFVKYFDAFNDQMPLIMFLAPYALMAELSFFAIARKAIFNTHEEQHVESETIDL
jgi:hypothetical protein